MAVNDSSGLVRVLRWDSVIGKVFITLAMAGASLFLALLIHLFGGGLGGIAIVAVVGTIVAYYALVNEEFGFYAVIVYAFFVNFVKRLIYGLGISYEALPLGIGVNVLLIVVLLGILIRQISQKKSDWSGFWSPITMAVLIDILFTIIIAANPMGPGIGHWLQHGFRWIVFDVTLLVVAFQIFRSLRAIAYFTRFWLILILITGLYTMWQEFVGLPSWDYIYLHSSPEIFKLNFIGGRFRLSGMLGDVSEAGLFMAYSAIVLIVFFLYSKRASLKAQMTFLLLVALLATNYSGTRTAFAIIPIGFGLFAMTNIKHRATVIGVVVGALVFLVIMFAPIHHPTIKRIRSTFNPGQDPSYQLREAKWARIQPWVRAHPLGSGLGTLGPLRENEEADSGYVAEAIERGWIGLMIKLGMSFTVMSCAVAYFFQSRKKMFKAYYLAYMCGFFIMTVAQMSQDALGKWPSYIILQCSFIIIIRLHQFENKTLTTDA